MSLLCPHLIHLWRPWQGIGKSPRRQVALKRHSTQGTEISLDDIDAEFARDNHCLTLCMYILCIYNVARASGNAQCACSCIYYACTCTYVHVHIPNVLVILYGRSAAIFPTDTQISRFPHYDSRIQSRVTHTRPKCLVQQPHILGQNVVYLSTVRAGIAGQLSSLKKLPCSTHTDPSILGASVASPLHVSQACNVGGFTQVCRWDLHK